MFERLCLFSPKLIYYDILLQRTFERKIAILTDTCHQIFTKYLRCRKLDLKNYILLSGNLSAGVVRNDYCFVETQTLSTASHLLPNLIILLYLKTVTIYQTSGMEKFYEKNWNSMS